MSHHIFVSVGYSWKLIFVFTILQHACFCLVGNSAMVQSTAASYDMMTAQDDHGQIYATNPTVSMTYPIATAQTAVSLVVTQGTCWTSIATRITSFIRSLCHGEE